MQILSWCYWHEVDIASLGDGVYITLSDNSVCILFIASKRLGIVESIVETVIKKFIFNIPMLKFKTSTHAQIQLIVSDYSMTIKLVNDFINLVIWLFLQMYSGL